MFKLRFLLAQLHMDTLMSKLRPKEIKDTLKNPPIGEKGLDATYKQAMKRIDGQEMNFRELAKQVLSWVTHAKRPLSASELQHAVSVTTGMPELDEDSLYELKDLISVCAGLVIVNKKSNIIRLIHYTTQDFFERT
jgi:hypothetical protein